MKEPKFIVVVGASAGGLMAVIHLIGQLKNPMDIAVCIVLHLQQVTNDSVLLDRLKRATAFTCKLAEDGDVLQKGTVYLAVPNQHLLVRNGQLLLGQGPQENRWRPSIDVLFRSAAVHYDGRVIGIVLSGLMEDGTAGMIAIKRCGGVCMVQDPEEAEYPDMVLSVMDHVAVDYCVPLEAMGAILEEKTRNGFVRHNIPDDIKAEARIAERVALGIENVEQLGPQSNFVCPDCGGGLWEMVNDHVVRYRCYTGHVYNEDELLIRQSAKLENTLWIALRMLEERKSLLTKMARQEQSRGWNATSNLKQNRAQELEEHIQRLKQILLEAKND